MCHDAASWLSGSTGLFASQLESRDEYATPPSMMTFFAPVARTVFTSSCMPATWNPMPVQVPPSFQQRHASAELELLSGYGSLNRSKITDALSLYAVATS